MLEGPPKEALPAAARPWLEMTVRKEPWVNTAREVSVPATLMPCRLPRAGPEVRAGPGELLRGAAATAAGSVRKTTASRRWPSGGRKPQAARRRELCVGPSRGRDTRWRGLGAARPAYCGTKGDAAPRGCAGPPGCPHQAGQEGWSAPERVALTTRSHGAAGAWGSQGPPGAPGVQGRPARAH